VRARPRGASGRSRSTRRGRSRRRCAGAPSFGRCAGSPGTRSTTGHRSCEGGVHAGARRVGVEGDDPVDVHGRAAGLGGRGEPSQDRLGQLAAGRAGCEDHGDDAGLVLLGHGVGGQHDQVGCRSDLRDDAGDARRLLGSSSPMTTSARAHASSRRARPAPRPDPSTWPSTGAGATASARAATARRRAVTRSDSAPPAAASPGVATSSRTVAAMDDCEPSSPSPAGVRPSSRPRRSSTKANSPICANRKKLDTAVAMPMPVSAAAVAVVTSFTRSTRATAASTSRGDDRQQEHLG